MSIQRKEHLNLEHLKDVRSVLRWCYDHGLLKGKFPDSDSGSKSYILYEAAIKLEEFLQQAELRGRIAELRECSDLQYIVKKADRIEWVTNRAVTLSAQLKTLTTTKDNADG